MVAGRRAAVEVGCEEVEEERARVGGDAVVAPLPMGNISVGN